MSGELAKANLYKLTETAASDANNPPTVRVDEKSRFVVQFNPTSLKIAYTNEPSGGDTTTSQAKQFPVQGHATLSFDLEFDTAEGDENGRPKDVRDLTARVLDFVRPPKDDPKKAPPRIRFEWGKVHFDGIVSAVNEDIDYFSAEGLPLRSKLSLTIKEQNLKLEGLASGPPRRDDKAASKPGEVARTGGPGSGPSKNPVTTAAAQAGESVQQALARLKADPGQWRTAMAGLSSPLNLSAGTQIQLGAEISASAGVGVTAGFGAGQTVGATASQKGGIAASAEADAGFRLSAAGGVTADTRTALSGRASASAAAARSGFAVPPREARVDPAPTVDRRATSYGYGVPLKARATIR